MPEKDGPEIHATMQSLMLLLQNLINRNEEVTSRYLDWFLSTLAGLVPFASPATTQKLKRIIDAFTQMKTCLHGEEIDDRFSALARNTMQLMRELGK